MTRLPLTYRSPEAVKAATRAYWASRAIKSGDGVVILDGAQRVRWHRTYHTIEHEVTK